MATLLSTSDDFKHERLLDLSRGEYLQSDLRVIHSGGTRLNPDLLRTPQMSWLTGSTMGLMLHAVTAHPDDDPYIVGLAKQPQIQHRLEIPYIIDHRKQHESRDIIEYVKSLRESRTLPLLWAGLSPIKLIKEYYPTQALKTALENSAPDLKLPDFDVWLWNEVKRFFDLFLPVRSRSEPAKHNKCGRCQHEKDKDEAICPNCGQPDLYLNHEAFWRDRVSPGLWQDQAESLPNDEDDGPIIEVADPTTMKVEDQTLQEIAFKDIIAKMDPRNRLRLEMWCKGFAYKEIAREVGANQPDSEQKAVQRALNTLKKSYRN